MTEIHDLDSRPPSDRLRELLLSRIRTGQWRPRQDLPNEVQLANAFRVSVGTVRRAMNDLSDLGFVTRQRGAATSVNEPDARGACSIFDSIRDANGAAIHWDPSRLEVNIDGAAAREARELRRPQSGCEVLRLTWLRSRHRRALVLQRSVVPVDTGVDVERARTAGDLGELYDHAGIVVFRSEDHFRVTTPDPETAHRLEVSRERALQHVSRKYFDRRGKVVGMCSSWLALNDEHYTCTRWACQSDSRSA